MIRMMCNGRLSDDTRLLDRGLHYGDGLFETMAVCKGRIALWERHWQRLLRGCQRLHITSPDKSVLESEIDSLIQGQERVVLKLILTRGQGERGYRIPPQVVPNRYLFLSAWPEYDVDPDDRQVRLHVCETRLGLNPALAGIKHLNRLEQVLARSEWQDPQIQEGIMLDQQGHVIEGTMSNLFWVKQQRLYTADLSQCGVTGIMRELVIEAAQSLKLPLQIGLWPLSELLSAEEIFITNSLICLWPVRYINNNEYTPGPVTNRLQLHLSNLHEFQAS